MNTTTIKKQHVILIAGDVITLTLVTVFGFASHGTVATAGTRMLATFIPLSIAWFLIAPHLGVFDLERAREARQLWRPFWAMILAAPLGAWMRGVWLKSPILPLFVVILGGVSALCLLAWRTLYVLVISWKK
jgi:hypothetical protein